MTQLNSRRTRRRAAVLLPVVGLLAAACGGDDGGDGGTDASGGGGGEACYEQGDRATFVVPFSPGGGYDTIARGLAPYLEDELGVTVVVQNEPGAGGLTAANNLYNAEPDGLNFGLFAAQGIVGSALAEAEGVQYDPENFTYVARLAEDARVLLTGADSELSSIEDVTSASGELQYATAGVGAADHIDANVLPTILGIEDNVQIVTGFEGSSETELAVTSGQVELGSGTLGTRLGGIENGDQSALLLMGRERDDALPDVPALLELDIEDPELAEAYIGLQEVGRSVFAPPDLPENCLTELQTALENTLNNEEFQAEIGDSVDVPFEYTDGEGLREAVDNVLNAPEELVTLLQNAYEGS
jgi:tripartite-type tricarboxylate transporter receptor subunit TctC